MKSDLNDQILSEQQLGNVQGGFGVCEAQVVTRCMYPKCEWKYSGPKEKAAIAQQSHTNETGHNQFTESMQK